MRREHTTEDGVPFRRPCQEEAGTGPGTSEPREYQISPCRAVKGIGGTLVVCWGIFLAYMILSSRKDGVASHVLAYGFLAFGLFAAAYILGSLVRAKFIVRDATITQYFVFAKPKTYPIGEITRVVVHGGRGTSYRIYIGRKKVFTLADAMKNADRFLLKLQNNHVPFKSSIF